jgi:hypothetical protein
MFVPSTFGMNICYCAICFLHLFPLILSEEYYLSVLNDVSIKYHPHAVPVPVKVDVMHLLLIVVVPLTCFFHIDPSPSKPRPYRHYWCISVMVRQVLLFLPIIISAYLKMMIVLRIIPNKFYKCFHLHESYLFSFESVKDTY